MNLAVAPDFQGRGLGRLLLQHCCRVAREDGCGSIAIATANSSISQLRLYQQEGFEMHELRRNFFLDAYAEPIFEHGIQAKHSILLVKTF